MSISSIAISGFFCQSTDGLVHTFFRKEKVYNSDTKTSVDKGVPFIVVTREETQFEEKTNYFLLGNFHTSLQEAPTLMVFPYRIEKVDPKFNVSQVSFIGRLGMDPEVFHTEGGTSVKFSLAHSEFLNGTNYNGKEGNEPTVWTKCSILPNKGNRGETFLNFVEDQVKQTGKKPQVGVIGSMTIQSYTDKQGSPRLEPRVLVNSIEFLGASGKTKAYEPVSLKNLSVPGTTDYDDEIPF